jgi:branched-chain amino acid transport system ATP-binding protein
MVMNRGELVAEGSPEQVRANPLVQAVYLGAGSLRSDQAEPRAARHA